jgi:hypothetical protein
MTKPPSTIGQRFYAVRLACGDGVRTAMPLREFAAKVTAETGRTLHASELSEIERDKKADISVHDVDAVAAVDPLRRGRLWLGWGEDLPLSEPAAPAAGVDTRPSYVRLAEQYGLGVMKGTDPAEELAKRGLAKQPAKKTAASKGRRGKH